VVPCSLVSHRVFSCWVSVWFFSLGVRCSVFRVVIWLVLMVCVGSFGVLSGLCVIFSVGLVVCFLMLLYSPWGSIITMWCVVLLAISVMIMVAVWVFPAPSMAVMSVCLLVRSSASM